MHMQVVQFNLRDMGEEKYRQLCDDLAPSFADLPGLISKVWLADPTTNTYGGVYSWSDRHNMEAFSESALYQAVVTHPNLTNLTSRDYAVIEAPTEICRGLATVRA